MLQSCSLPTLCANGRHPTIGDRVASNRQTIWFAFWHCQGASAKIFWRIKILILNVYIDTWHGSGSQNTLELKEFSAAFFSDWPKQPRAVQVMPSNPHQAVSAYNKTLTETATPRQLEEQFLLKAAATLQRVLDSWTDKPSGLNEAVLYNRRLWIVLIDAVIRDDNKLPIAIRQNVLNIGAFVMAETFSLMTKPEPEHLASIIRINRRIAAGLRGKAVTHDAPQAA